MESAPGPTAMPALCRDCEFEIDGGGICPGCGSPRVVSHPELFELSIAHVDCDAFYASVEKRDRPELRDKPVIVGGRKRGVVSTACYIARIRGVRSAMPMYKALRLCPDAVVIKPDMERYVCASRTIRTMMEDLTPAIEPLSLDEAFMDLSGTRRLHGTPPAVLLSRLARRIESEVGVSGSIGLSHNKFLAKIASDLEKPRGFSIIGREETEEFLASKPVTLMFGVGAATQRRLDSHGIKTFRDLRSWTEPELKARFGEFGGRLWHLCRGKDARRVKRDRSTKSLSSETTFPEDIGDAEELDGHVWRLSERVADRLKAKQFAGRTVVLKLKRSNHSTATRRESMQEPTNKAEIVYRTARGLLDRFPESGPFRLIGVGVTGISKVSPDEDVPPLDPAMRRKLEVERATDRIRAKHGRSAIVKGRALR